LHATKENSKLKQEVVYLSSRLDRTIVSEKIIEEDLSRVEESAIKSTYKLSVSFERCEDKSEKSPSKFVPNSNYHKEKEALKSTKNHYPSNPKSSFNPKRGVKKILQIQVRKSTFACFMTVQVIWMSFVFDAREWRRDMWTVMSPPLTRMLVVTRIFMGCHY
jgi:hypothetical protein